MEPFHYQDGDLYCEGVPVREIAREFGTPCYVYSYSKIREEYRRFDAAFSSIPRMIAYAVKANSNGAILRILARAGSGADVVSGGEIHRARAAGIPANRIVFAGVGKSHEELRLALDEDILLINVESLGELDYLSQLAHATGKKVRIGVRVNPQITVPTHPYISTGRAEDKFGLAPEQALAAYRRARTDQMILPVGIHMHIGSQISDLSIFRTGAEVLVQIMESLAEEEVKIQYFDLGGGLAVPESGEGQPLPEELAGTVLPALEGFEGTLILEPGREIIAAAGVLLARVLYRKPTAARPFVIIDAGMNDFIRPALYGAEHRILAVQEGEGEETVRVVGPICESADIFATAVTLPPVREGDYIAILHTGAYGASMSSRYNSRPLPAEVLVRAEEAYLIRERETVEDIIDKERIPQFLL
ncbi:MAG TPA: diaminopimelate decarboxylase [Candidatus Acetothermia bacterium]|nr:diaminopimelate decarboxylase [Candidatus Acetothermia bacterium]